MDISDTLAPNSDQLDACDLVTGPRIFTIKGVIKGTDEQPVQVQLVEFPRVWRPSKGMRRVLAACWGVNAEAWIGRRVELYCDPTVIFGKDAVGGTRIARLSHIDREQKIPLLVSRGKSAVFAVKPLAAVSQPGGQSHVTPSQDPPAADRSAMAGTSATETTAPEASSSPEPLLTAINRQVKDMQASGSSSFLTTWAQSQGVNPSSKALAEKFGERARDLRALMAELPTDVQP